LDSYHDVHKLDLDLPKLWY